MGHGALTVSADGSLARGVRQELESSRGGTCGSISRRLSLSRSSIIIAMQVVMRKSAGLVSGSGKILSGSRYDTEVILGHTTLIFNTSGQHASEELLAKELRELMQNLVRPAAVYTLLLLTSCTLTRSLPRQLSKHQTADVCWHAYETA